MYVYTYIDKYICIKIVIYRYRYICIYIGVELQIHRKIEK